MHIVFAGGAIAGQWFSGLTVAHQIRSAARTVRITFLGTGHEFESRNATTAGFQYLSLPPQPSSGGFGQAWRRFADSFAACRAARRYFKRERPDLVVGLGGHASAPGIRAALAAGIPVALLEYNAIPSLVTRKYAGRAAVVFGGFPQMRDELEATGPVRIVGNPIRAAFAKVFRLRQQAALALKPNDENVLAPVRQLVVLAGAAGNGRALNEHVPKALYKLRDALAGWQILHQAGSRDVTSTKALYDKLDVRAEVVSFIPDMPRVLLGTDVAIGRPGGITLSELAAAAVPAIVVPTSSKAERHQTANAAAFERAGACRVVDEATEERRLDDRVAAALGELVIDSTLRARMSTAMARLARPDAAWQVASTVLDLARTAALQKVA